MLLRTRTRRVGRLVFAVTVAVVMVIGLAAAGRVHAKAPACTHGLSSIGPVYLKDGKVVGDATPHTEACLP